jgi:hypothetical protein
MLRSTQGCTILYLVFVWLGTPLAVYMLLNGGIFETCVYNAKSNETKITGCVKEYRESNQPLWNGLMSNLLFLLNAIVLTTLFIGLRIQRCRDNRGLHQLSTALDEQLY